jgi:hypothetical protein
VDDKAGDPAPNEVRVDTVCPRDDACPNLHTSFALRAKDSTPFHSEEPNGATLPSAKEKPGPKQPNSAENSRIRLF